MDDTIEIRCPIVKWAQVKEDYFTFNCFKERCGIWNKNKNRCGFIQGD
jgi:hypothetical protein